MNRLTMTLSRYRCGCWIVLLAALAVMATAQTNSAVKSSLQPVAKTQGSAKAGSHAKTSSPAGNAGATPTPAQGANGPMDPGNASMSAPPGWAPPNHNAPQGRNQQSSKTGSKANAKKGKVVSGAKK